jgi:hypothetical protein
MRRCGVVGEEMDGNRAVPCRGVREAEARMAAITGIQTRFRSTVTMVSL